MDSSTIVGIHVRILYRFKCGSTLHISHSIYTISLIRIYIGTEIEFVSKYTYINIVYALLGIILKMRQTIKLVWNMNMILIYSAYISGFNLVYLYLPATKLSNYQFVPTLCINKTTENISGFYLC